MIILIKYLFILFLTIMSACLKQVNAQNEIIDPPKAKINPKKIKKHGEVRTDNYFWLKNKNDLDVIEYLNEENAYADMIAEVWKPLQDKIADEIKSRISPTDISVPYRKNNYLYYTRYEKDSEFPIYCRKKDIVNSVEEILIDVNQEAKIYPFYNVFSMEISPNNETLAFTIDTTGGREYFLMFKDLKNNQILPQTISNVSSVVWAADNKTLFYTSQNPITLRSEKAYRYQLGDDITDSKLIYYESDEVFDIGFYVSKSKQFIFLVAGSYTTTEYRFLKSNEPDKNFTMFYPRQANHEYGIEHYQDKFYILTNKNAQNFKIMQTDIDNFSEDNWKVVIPHDENKLIEGLEVFKDYILIEERQNGLPQIRIIDQKDKTEHYLDFKEATYDVAEENNEDYDTNIFRFYYTSLITPDAIYDYDMKTRQKTLLKQQTIVTGYDANDYIAERIYATAPDGVKVPISIVYKKDLIKDGNNICLLTGYGAYGNNAEIYFDPARISLLDRNCIVAIAHIRGGSDLGRDWYYQGKLLNKKNTFLDFIACAETLINKGYTSSDKLFAEGGSAGGMLVTAVANLKPELFKGIIALVPFVDVVTTMTDKNIPLTTGEYEEWGNPEDKIYFDYMLSYSPYDNIQSQSYPNMLVISALNDSQVLFHEPTKYVAKLRASKTDNNLLILKTDMETGHEGKLGRFEIIEEIAFIYSFILYLSQKND